ncbi:hypothetical protein LWF15_03835 [Kineosporia rhizophila]|uniref:hypothetical protein n=1 Tax=Kineosporia TaxID=49184 RepID=UPI001E38ABC6|nr:MULTISPECIES: hypothetical protein [Kineosporia]MCE0534630.1 hypothetical protein [Kineosporia rhizophila]GLY15579.1 hypothetical protein Kisp01_25940 [Kineosporia sp. NBRC 101677]
MRKTKLVAAVLVSAGLLFGASGTALAAGNDLTPEPSPTAEERTRPAPVETTARPSKRPSEATPTAMPRDEGKVPAARPARPVQGDPSFTG